MGESRGHERTESTTKGSTRTWSAPLLTFPPAPLPVLKRNGCLAPWTRGPPPRLSFQGWPGVVNLSTMPEE